MQFLREIRTFSGKKAFFSCNFQLQSEARRRLLVRSCLGAPPATAHGGHWDVAATGDGLPWPKFHGNFGDNSWETPGIEPWSHGAHGWSTWWTFGQRGAGKCDGLELHEAVLLWALKLWGHQTEMVAVAKKVRADWTCPSLTLPSCAKWWSAISMLDFFLRPVRRLPHNSPHSNDKMQATGRIGW